MLSTARGQKSPEQDEIRTNKRKQITQCPKVFLVIALGTKNYCKNNVLKK